MEGQLIARGLALLALRAGASEDEIRARRREIAAELHPDKGAPRGDMEAVNAAVATLLEAGAAPGEVTIVDGVLGVRVVWTPCLW